jgi:hypothetical protein
MGGWRHEASPQLEGICRGCNPPHAKPATPMAGVTATGSFGFL